MKNELVFSPFYKEATRGYTRHPRSQGKIGGAGI